jgi:hypothetical protein
MKPTEVQLLKSLGSGVRPFDVLGEQAPLSSQSETNFDGILTSAIRGSPETDLGVRFAPSVSGLYEQADQWVIARGVDRAAAAGVDHALILHDQRTLRVDVRNRVVLDACPISDQQVIGGINGFVSINELNKASDSGEQSMLSREPLTPARVVRNGSLVHALAGRVPD